MLAWLAHPMTLVALVLLVVNDHVGKRAHPGMVTGKLSDVGGLVVAPPLLAMVMVLLVPRLRGQTAAVVAVVATGAGFATVQLSPTVAEVASQAWSVVAGPSRLYADPTDLIALPALAVAWWAWRRARPQPVPHRLVRLARVLVVLPGAMLAVAATSVDYPYASAAAEWEGALAAGETNVAGDIERGLTWRLSTDSGHSWRALDSTEQQRLEARRPAVEVQRRQACVPGDAAHCYRLEPGQLRVEESRDDGTSWHTSWEITDAQRRALSRHYPYVDDPVSDLSSVALTVSATDDGHVVLVANGRDGFVLRTADEQWHRIGFPTRNVGLPHWDDPIRSTWAPYGVLWGLVAMILAGSIVLGTIRRPGSRRRGRWLLNVPGLLLTAAGLTWLITFNTPAEPADSFEGFIWLLGAAPACAGLVLCLVEPLHSRALSAGQWLVLVPGAVVVGGLTSIPLVAVSAGHPGAIAAAALTFGIATTVLTVAGSLLGHGDQPPPTRTPATKIGT